MKFITALCVCMVLAALEFSYYFLNSPVVPLEHRWLVMALSVAGIFMTLSATLLSASYDWPAGYETVKYWWRGSDGERYFDPITLPLPRKGLKDAGTISFSFGLLMLLGTMALVLASLNGLTLSPLNLGPTFEPLVMLLLFAALATAAIWRIQSVWVQPDTVGS